MKCPHCGQEHPDDFLLCPYTGKPLKSQTKVCGNPDCQYSNVPIEAKFCPRCGWAFSQDDNDSSKQKRETFIKDNNGLTDYNIVLGKTTVDELETTFNIMLEQEYYDDEYCELKLEQGITIFARNKKSVIYAIRFDDIENNVLRNILKTVFHIQDFSNKYGLKNLIKNYCNKNSWQIKFVDDDCVVLIPDKRWIIHCIFDEGELDDFEIYYIPQCPHCNESVQIQIDDFDHSNCWLRCKQCKKRFELSEELKKEILVCPSCGSDDFEDDGSGYVQYTCNRCGHIWGDEKDEDDWDDNDEDEEDCDEDDDEDYDDELHRFFPVCGITLGETTVEEAEEQDYLYSEIEYCDSDLVIAWTKNTNGYPGAQIRKEKYDDCFTNIYITNSNDMFPEWEDLGFDWNLSYNEWIELFKDWDYDIDVVTPPHKELWEEKNYWYLDATVRAIAPDDSVYFELEFSYGRNGYKQKSQGTLYSISVSIDLEHLDM